MQSDLVRRRGLQLLADMFRQERLQPMGIHSKLRCHERRNSGGPAQPLVPQAPRKGKALLDGIIPFHHLTLPPVSGKLSPR